MKTTIFLSFLFLFILVGGYLWKDAPNLHTPTLKPAPVLTVPAAINSTATNTTTETPANSSAAPSSTASSPTYTAAQVATHNSDSSCWTIINGNVYNLTSWISQHPGGPEHIEAICGIDGTSAFEAQHGNQAQPNAILATFKIGTLAT